MKIIAKCSFLSLAYQVHVKFVILFLTAAAPWVTRYAELGGSWKSEVNKGNHVRQGLV